MVVDFVAVHRKRLAELSIEDLYGSITPLETRRNALAKEIEHIDRILDRYRTAIVDKIMLDEGFSPVGTAADFWGAAYRTYLYKMVCAHTVEILPYVDWRESIGSGPVTEL